MSYIDAVIVDKNYKIGSPIALGAGTYGIAQGYNEVAIKNIEGIRLGLRELSFYSILRHPNIINVIGWTSVGDDVSIILPRGISIFRAIKSGQTTLEDVARDLFNGLYFLNTNGIAHCDIKPANTIFVDGRSMFIDLGISSYATYGLYINDTVRTYYIDGESYSPPYKDPLYNDGGYYSYSNIKVELYAFGRSLYDIFRETRGAPFDYYEFDVEKDPVPNPIINNLILDCIKPLLQRLSIQDLFVKYQRSLMLQNTGFIVWTEREALRPFTDKEETLFTNIKRLIRDFEIVMPRTLCCWLDLVHRLIRSNQSESLTMDHFKTAFEMIDYILYKHLSTKMNVTYIIDIAIAVNGIFIQRTFWDLLAGEQLLNAILLLMQPGYNPQKLPVSLIDFARKALTRDDYITNKLSNGAYNQMKNDVLSRLTAIIPPIEYGKADYKAVIPTILFFRQNEDLIKRLVNQLLNKDLIGVSDEDAEIKIMAKIYYELIMSGLSGNTITLTDAEKQVFSDFLATQSLKNIKYAFGWLPGSSGALFEVLTETNRKRF